MVFMQRRRSNPSHLNWAAVVFITVFGAATALLNPGVVTRAVSSIAAQPQRFLTVVELQPDQHFAGCNQARAAGRENIPRSDPSYRAFMDGDGDGLACEPYRR